MSRCLTTDAIMCSITLHKIHVREMGRLLAAADFSPFLNMGEILAEFHIDGTAPDSSERSKTTLRIGASFTLSSCRTKGLILPGTAVFFGFRFLRRFIIPASEIEISGITGVEFLNSSGKASGGMTLSSTRSCTFMRESGASGVNTDWNCWFKMLALSLVSVCRFSFCFRVVFLVDRSGNISGRVFYCPLDRLFD